jgi:hypothetical protein
METAYDTNMIVVRQLEAALDVTDPRAFPFLKAVGMNSYPGGIQNSRYEWQIDYALPHKDALAAAVTSTSATSFTVAHAEYFALHDMIKIDTELCRVLTIDATNNYILVERGFAGSTAATHSNAAVVDRLGPARPEGSSPGWGMATATVQPYNVTQIFDFDVSVTKTQRAQNYYGASDIKAYRMKQGMDNLFMRMEKSLIYNLRYAPSTNVGRVSGGLVQFVHDEDAQSGGDLTQAVFLTALQNVVARAGEENVPLDAWMNYTAKSLINVWGEGSIRTDRGETVYGSVVDQLFTDYGTINLNLDHLFATDDVWLLNMSKIQMAPLNGRGLAELDATLPGEDAERSRVLGEYGFVVKGEDGTNDGLHVRISGFATS